MVENKEFVWEIEGYSGSVKAKNYDEARKIINNLMCVQEVEE